MINFTGMNSVADVKLHLVQNLKIPRYLIDGDTIFENGKMQYIQ